MLQFYIFTVVVSVIDQLFLTILYLVRELENKIDGRPTKYPLLYGDILMRGLVNFVPFLNLCPVAVDVIWFIFICLTRYSKPIIDRDYNSSLNLRNYTANND